MNTPNIFFLSIRFLLYTFIYSVSVLALWFSFAGLCSTFKGVVGKGEVDLI